MRGWWSRPNFPAVKVDYWAAVRCTTPDRLPVVGPLQRQTLPGLCISTALGAVAGSLTGDRNTGAYTAQMGTKWNLFGMEVTEEEQEQTEEILNSMGMKIGEIMTGNDREYIKEKFSESALDGATALAEWTKNHYSEIMVDETFKGELRLGGLKFLSKLAAWIDLASVLKFNIDFQYEKYEELNIKFEEKGESYWVDVYNRLKENTSDVMD